MQCHEGERTFSPTKAFRYFNLREASAGRVKGAKVFKIVLHN